MLSYVLYRVVLWMFAVQNTNVNNIETESPNGLVIHYKKIIHN